MRRPKVSIENRREVYDFYRQYDPHPLSSKLGHALMAAAYRPVVSYTDGAEDQIGKMLDEGKQFILVSNHRNAHDQCNVAAIAHRETQLRRLRGNTSIPAKAGLFGMPLLRRSVEIMGSMPVFRAKDIRADYRDVPFNDEESDALRDSGKLLIDASINKLSKGRHLYMFPEGTRGERDTELGTLRRGIGEIACGASDDADLAIIPIGLYYNGNNFRPNMHITNPIDGPFREPVALVNHLSVVMQDALTTAASFRSNPLTA